MPRIGKFFSVLLSLGNAEAVYVLLQTGANIFSIDKEDRTVLYWAAMQNHKNVIDVRNLSYPTFYTHNGTFINYSDKECNWGHSKIPVLKPPLKSDLSV